VDGGVRAGELQVREVGVVEVLGGQARANLVVPGVQEDAPLQPLEADGLRVVAGARGAGLLTEWKQSRKHGLNVLLRH
jgi:hypothetical protein